MTNDSGPIRLQVRGRVSQQPDKHESYQVTVSPRIGYLRIGGHHAIQKPLLDEMVSPPAHEETGGVKGNDTYMYIEIYVAETSLYLLILFVFAFHVKYAREVH